MPEDAEAKTLVSATPVFRKFRSDSPTVLGIAPEGVFVHNASGVTEGGSKTKAFSEHTLRKAESLRRQPF
jgi:hypothetical protein